MHHRWKDINSTVIVEKRVNQLRRDQRARLSDPEQSLNLETTATAVVAHQHLFLQYHSHRCDLAPRFVPKPRMIHIKARLLCVDDFDWRVRQILHANLGIL